MDGASYQLSAVGPDAGGWTCAGNRLVVGSIHEAARGGTPHRTDSGGGAGGLQAARLDKA